MSKLNRIKSRREQAYARWHSLGKQKAWDWVICWDVAYHNEIKNEEHECVEEPEFDEDVAAAERAAGWDPNP
jgi:hypothetical protein